MEREYVLLHKGLNLIIKTSRFTKFCFRQAYGTYAIKFYFPKKLELRLEAGEFLQQFENIHQTTINPSHSLPAWGCSSHPVTIATHFNRKKLL